MLCKIISYWSAVTPFLELRVSGLLILISPNVNVKNAKTLTSLGFAQRDKKTHYLSGIEVESPAVRLILLGDFYC